MRLLHRLGWACAIFGIVVLAGYLRTNEGLFGVHTGGWDTGHSIKTVIDSFIQCLWIVFIIGGVSMALDHYWGRWAVAISGLLIFAELINYELLPAIARGLNQALSIMLFTLPAVAIGRGPLSWAILFGIVYVVIAKGLARRPSSERRGSAGEHLRTRETDV